MLWVELLEKHLQALMPIVLGIIAIYIASQQKEIQRQMKEIGEKKFRLDLYEKRWAVYAAVREMTQHVFENGNLSKFKMGNFYRAFHDSQFIFGEEVISYMDEIRQKAHRLSALPGIRDQEFKKGRDISALADEESQLMEWFVHQASGDNEFYKPWKAVPAVQIFSKYMKVE